MITRLVWSFAVLAALLPAVGGTQTPRVAISGTASCASCRLQLHRLALIGDEDGPGALSDDASIVADADGNFYVLDPGAAPSSVVVFSPQGRYSHTLGRRGGGPGEFGIPTKAFVTRDGTVHVFDLRERRVSRFSQGRTFVGAVRWMVAPSSVIAIGPDRYAVNAVANTADRIGLIYHLVDGTGSVLKSFGPPDMPVLPGQQDFARRALSPRRGGGFWSVGLNRYVIEQWSADGELQRELHRTVDWFPAWTTPIHPPAVERPKPMLSGVFEDPQGRLWTFIHVPKRGWRPAPRAPGQEGSFVRTEYDANFDTIIEVIDPTSARVLVSSRVPRRLVPISGTDLLSTYREVGGTKPEYEIWRLRLYTTPTGGPK